MTNTKIANESSTQTNTLYLVENLWITKTELTKSLNCACLELYRDIIVCRFLIFGKPPRSINFCLLLSFLLTFTCSTLIFALQYSLRQLDLSLLSQLWSLNESIQDFRQILQEQEDRVLSPPSPSPTPSSGDEGDADEFYMSTSSMNFRTPPPPVPVRRPSSSSNASSLG